jgi:hypothetical protein
MSNEQGQQLGIDMANNFMLMTLFSIVADMAEDRMRLDPTSKKPCSI